MLSIELLDDMEMWFLWSLGSTSIITENFQTSKELIQIYNLFRNRFTSNTRYFICSMYIQRCSTLPDKRYPKIFLTEIIKMKTFWYKSWTRLYDDNMHLYNFLPVFINIDFILDTIASNLKVKMNSFEGAVGIVQFRLLFILSTD